ncbi:hypothetical protein OB955_23825 [Halobacteria archaeon AArc-m2/3/4]|uniref:Uncharacterized protein n=1 Tax=Natronoglomus mannanivorans TaxID=2979990 RepID=A0ABT2QLA2_9EURY|nr:hypothetical protein [Halobacteria archaeon AArc-m2/3/4]
MDSPLLLRHWLRLGCGSAVSFGALGWFYRYGFDTPPTDALLPLGLAAIGVVLVWPVVLRAAFGGLLTREPDEIYNEIVSDEE